MVVRCRIQPDTLLTSLVLHTTSLFYIFSDYPCFVSHWSPSPACPLWVCTALSVPAPPSVLLHSLISCKVQADLPGSSTSSFLIVHQLVWVKRSISCHFLCVCFVRYMSLHILSLASTFLLSRVALKKVLAQIPLKEQTLFSHKLFHILPWAVGKYWCLGSWNNTIHHVNKNKPKQN